MLQVKTTDKVYIDGPRCSKTLADVLLERFERVSQVNHFYILGSIEAVLIQYSWVLEFPHSNVYSTIGLGNFLIVYF